MPAKTSRKSRPSGVTYQLKITLRGSKPPIWRRILVPAECNLETLHAAIQIAMGWYNSHLHAFGIGGEEFSGRDPMGGKVDSWGMDATGLDAAKYRLSEVASREKATFTYQYDFGDSWDHVIVVEKILPPPVDGIASASFSCIAGARACPPEDCGGIWGYENLLKILGNRKHAEHEEMKEWAGEIDSEMFDLAAVNKRMSRIKA